MACFCFSHLLHVDVVWSNSDATCLKLLVLSSVLINLFKLPWETVLVSEGKVTSVLSHHLFLPILYRLQLI